MNLYKFKNNYIQANYVRHCVTSGVWFLYEARHRIRAIRSRAHWLFEHGRYTEPGSE